MSTPSDAPLIPMETLTRIAPAIRVLAHPVRLRLVELMLEGELPVGELARRVGVRPNVASQHLSTMRAHGLLSSRRHGKEVHYQVVGPEAIHLISCIRTNHT